MTVYYKQEQDTYDWDGDIMINIMDPGGRLICICREDQADVLLSHLNRHHLTTAAPAEGEYDEWVGDPDEYDGE